MDKKLVRHYQKGLLVSIDMSTRYIEHIRSLYYNLMDDKYVSRPTRSFESSFFGLLETLLQLFLRSCEPKVRLLSARKIIRIFWYNWTLFSQSRDYFRVIFIQIYCHPWAFLGQEGVRSSKATSLTVFTHPKVSGTKYSSMFFFLRRTT